MRNSGTSLMLVVLGFPGLCFAAVAFGQADSITVMPKGPTAVGAARSYQTQPAGEDAGPAPSQIFKTSMDGLAQTVGGLRLEKWKGGSIRAEAGANVASIQKDIQGPLPALLADADAAPRSVAKLLLVSRNVDALYDVLLRVVDGARVAAPGEQVGQLQQVMSDLEKARLTFDGLIEETAAAKEKQIDALQVSLKTQAAPVCPVVAPAKPAAIPAKKVVKKKPKPAAPKPSPGTAAPGGATAPSTASPSKTGPNQ